MVRKTITILFFVAVAPLSAAMQAQNTAPPPKPGAEAVLPPQNTDAFAGLKVGETIADTWHVGRISAAPQSVSVELQSAQEPKPFTLVLSFEKGPPGAFDTDGVRIYYLVTQLPPATIDKIGRGTIARITSFASAHGGLKAYLTEFLGNAAAYRPAATLTREAALRFLDQLKGKWTVTELLWEEGKTVPKTIGSGTAERRRFLNDLILREDASGAAGSQSMTIGCVPENSACWMFLIDDTSSGYKGGRGNISENGKSLTIVNESREAVATIRIVDENRNIIEIYAPGGGGRVARSIRYERAR